MNVRPLLDFIADLESNGNYNAVYGNTRATRDLSQYNLNMIDLQQLEHGKRTGSSAFGRYQFIRKTLIGLRNRLGVSGLEKFTDDLQDRLAIALLESRGLRKWANGGMTDDQFMDSLSKEWASLPYRNGKSYYDGDGMNHSLATRGQFKAVLRKVKSDD